MRKLLGHILCLLGWHRWRYGDESANVALGWDGHFRVCRRCKYREHHCWFHDDWR